MSDPPNEHSICILPQTAQQLYSLNELGFSVRPRKPTENLDAYDLYLRGMVNVHQITSREAVDEALRLLRGAIELDPAFETLREHPYDVEKTLRLFEEANRQ